MVRVLALLIFATGCATRHVPKTLPTSAAANPDAPPATAYPVGAVVRDEPPLPGEPSKGWPALEQTNAP